MNSRPKRSGKIVKLLALIAVLGVAWHDYAIYCRAYDCDRLGIAGSILPARKDGSPMFSQRAGSSALLENTIVLKYFVK